MVDIKVIISKLIDTGRPFYFKKKYRKPNTTLRHYSPVKKLTINGITDFRTETDFARYLLTNFGEGRYLCVGYKKYLKGYFNYWNGEIYAEYWIRFPKKDKELYAAKQQLAKATDPDDIEMYKEEVEFIQELKKEEVGKEVVSGPLNLMKLQVNVPHGYYELPLPRNPITPQQRMNMQRGRYFKKQKIPERDFEGRIINPKDYR